MTLSSLGTWKLERAKFDELNSDMSRDGPNRCRRAFERAIGEFVSPSLVQGKSGEKTAFACCLFMSKTSPKTVRWIIWIDSLTMLHSELYNMS